MKLQNEFYTESEIAEVSQFFNLPINTYNFYISRQKSIDSEGRYNEIAAILNLKITKININGNDVESIDIHFRAEGGIKSKPQYYNKKVQIEMPEKDLNFWLTGLQFPRISLDIQAPELGEDAEYLFLYLSAGKR